MSAAVEHADRSHATLSLHNNQGLSSTKNSGLFPISGTPNPVFLQCGQRLSSSIREVAIQRTILLLISVFHGSYFQGIQPIFVLKLRWTRNIDSCPHFTSTAGAIRVILSKPRCPTLIVILVTATAFTAHTSKPNETADAEFEVGGESAASGLLLRWAAGNPGRMERCTRTDQTVELKSKARAGLLGERRARQEGSILTPSSTFSALHQFASLKFPDLPVAAQRMVLLMRALISQPPLVLLDEVWSGMDAGMVAAAHAYLRTGGGVGKEQAVVVVTHLEDEVPWDERDGVVRVLLKDGFGARLDEAVMAVTREPETTTLGRTTPPILVRMIRVRRLAAPTHSSIAAVARKHRARKLTRSQAILLCK
ncbi:hypothetical protein R3P38DRAFT_3219094 [Favolaschia claudopus]|uniref:P-loop containing nucleoside triphosphate hydrolase protein n=1 Tax=Favolaschia claudopus TaxID=2862362 RepID=A0AAW0A3U9_9AGAR